MNINLDYAPFRQKVPKIIGVWDDHDYGLNNGNKYFKRKELVRDIFLDFLDEP